VKLIIVMYATQKILHNVLHLLKDIMEILLKNVQLDAKPVVMEIHVMFAKLVIR
jgi:hypothetical protein